MKMLLVNRITQVHIHDGDHVTRIHQRWSVIMQYRYYIHHI